MGRGRCVFLGIFRILIIFFQAVNLILKPRKFEQFPDIASAKITYKETSDATAAILRLRNRNKSIEGKLLTGLMKHNKNDYVNALENVSLKVCKKILFFLVHF